MDYQVSEDNLERQRLLERVNGPILDKLMDSLELSPGMRCLDLGCGIGETTRHLSRRLEDPIELIGVELDPALVEVARQIPSEGDSEIHYQQGDANDLEFEDESFDFVYARSLLMHMSAPEDVLTEMVRVCKPAGVVAVQEGDLGSQYCYPRSWAYERLPELWGKLVPNAFIGRKLWSLFQKVGYSTANITADLILELEEDVLKRFYRLTFEATVPGLIENSIANEEECRRMSEEFRRVEQDKNALCLNNPLFSAWVIRA